MASRGGHFRGGHGGHGGHASRNNPRAEAKKQCPTCTMYNPKDATTCSMCGGAMRASGRPAQVKSARTAPSTSEFKLKSMEVEAQPAPRQPRNQPRQTPPRREATTPGCCDGPDNECDACPPCCSENIFFCQKIWCCLSFCGIIFLISLLPASFVYFEYDEIGFVKYTITNNVDTTVSYDMGRYYTGPSHAAVVFPRAYLRVDSSLDVFPDNGQEFEINIVSFFRLDQNQLAQIYEQFGTSSVENQAATRIESTIKSLTPMYELEAYTLQRKDVTNTFYYGTEDTPGVLADLEEIGCIMEPDKFWLAETVIPDDVVTRNLDAAVQLELNTMEENEREAILVETETDRLEQQILGNVTVVEANADAQVQYIDALADATITAVDATSDATVSRLLDEANAESANLLARTDGDGFNVLFDSLGVNATGLKKKYIEYFALLQQKTA